MSDTERDVEAIVEQLRETGNRIDAAFDLKAYQRRDWKRSLRSLRGAGRKHYGKMAAGLPKITGRVRREWQSAASARIKAQYDQWIEQLSAILERLRTSS